MSRDQSVNVLLESYDYILSLNDSAGGTNPGFGSKAFSVDRTLSIDPENDPPSIFASASNSASFTLIEGPNQIESFSGIGAIGAIGTEGTKMIAWCNELDAEIATYELGQPAQRLFKMRWLTSEKLSVAQFADKLAISYLHLTANGDGAGAPFQFPALVGTVIDIHQLRFH